MIRQASTRVVYRNNWMSVREDETILPDGTPGLYGVIDKPDFAAIVPLHADGRIQLVDQYRYPVERRMWEIPMGGWPAPATGTPLELANAELVEETGLTAGKLEHLGRYHANPAMSSQGYHLFVATDLTQGATALEITEQDMETKAFTVSEIEALIDSEDITCAVTIAAIGLLRLKGRI